MKTFLIPQSVKLINNRLTKLGYAGLSLRNMELMAQLGKAGLINDNLVQWYQAPMGVQQSQNAVSSWLNLAPSRISLNKNLVQGTTANMPTWLHFVGSDGRYGYINAVAGNYFSAPDSNALDITGDIDIRVRAVSANNAVAQILLAKSQTVSQRSYLFQFTASGALQLGLSADGSATTTATSTALTTTPIIPTWYRVTWRQSDGRVQFFTSVDVTNWAQLGTDQSLIIASIFSSTSILEVGQRFAGTSTGFNGNIYRAQVYSGIPASEGGSGGTLVFDFNPATYVSGTTFLDSSVNAATITLNGGVVVITQSALYFDGVNDYLQTGIFTLSQPTTVYLVGKQITWTANDNIFDGSGSLNRMALIQLGTTPSLILSGNTGTTAASNSDLNLSVNSIITSVFNGANSSLTVNRGTSSSGNPGTNLANGFTLGGRYDGTALANITVSEVIVFNQALSPAQNNIVVGYLNEKYNLGL